MAQNNTVLIAGNGGAGTGEGFAIGGKGGDVHVTNSYGLISSDVATLMSLPRADDASYDSNRKGAPQSCLQGTRVAILDEIVSWLENENRETPPIYWLNGMAGVGKSTIAKTVAERAEEEGILGGSFFCSRSSGPLHDPRLIFPTIAFQLAQSDEFKQVILDAIQRNMTLGTKPLSSQFRGLILTPLLKAKPRRRVTLIILDALDECEKNGAVGILRVLCSHGTQLPFLRILITSRSEPHIRSVFDEVPNVTKRILHDVECQEDIRFYLRTELSKIPHKFRLPSGSNWVSEDEINSLAERSGSLFVYAATSIRFINDDYVRMPRRQLDLILNTQAAQEAGATPYTQLDSLYMGVLLDSLSHSNPGDVVKRFQLVIGSIVLLREPLPLRFLSLFVECKMHVIHDALYHLGSVIILPSNEDEAPHIYHPSFREFIMDPSRCSDVRFLIPRAPNQEQRHAIRCFRLLATFLKRDIAGISDASLLNKEVVGLEEKVREAVSSEVRYACRYWASHLSCVQLGDEMVAKELERFSMRSLLWWFEAMSLLGSVSTAVNSIEEAHRWVTKSTSQSNLVTMLVDARRFIFAHGEAIRASALHVYESALPFTPHDTLLYKEYHNEARNSFSVVHGVESVWPQGLSCLRGHYGPVRLITYSPDGSRLAAGSQDFTVRLWDAMSSAPIATLKGHLDSVTCIAFSANGLRLASGSYDSTVRVWDGTHGAHVGTLYGHSHAVTSIAFSPNGWQMASGSNDCTLRFWDARLGAPIATLQGHSKAIMSIAYSPDGSQIASGSYDCTVQLWDVMTHTPILTLKGHSDPVTFIGFSSNGLRLASSSWDCTVRLWDPRSGALIAIMEGRMEWGTFVAFSPNGLQVALGSKDHTVQFWDAMSGAPIAKLKAHSAAIVSIAYSPDGLKLALGSSDCTVQLWDLMSYALITRLEGHIALVASIAFSPNGFQIASGSNDCTLRLWDVMSHPPITTPESHSLMVMCIAFSLNGLQLASGSRDCTVRLWDAMSGRPIATLKGHSAPVMCVAFSLDGLQLASGSRDCTVQLWDVMSGTSIATLKGHSALVLSFSPRGLQLASGSPDHTVQLWDTVSGALIAQPPHHSAAVTSIAFSPDGSQLASGSSHGVVQLWDIMSRAHIIMKKVNSVPVQSLSFSPDGLQLGSRSFGGVMHWWDAISGAPIAEAPSEVSSLLWSRKGQWILLLLLPRYHARHVCSIPPHYSPCTDIAVPNLQAPSRVAFGCEDGRIIILDVSRSYVNL